VPLVNVQTLQGVVLLCICVCLYRVYIVGFNQASLIWSKPIVGSLSSRVFLPFGEIKQAKKNY